MADIALLHAPALRSASRELRAAVSSVAVLMLTSVHHAYGAVVYNTPWRMQVVYLSVPTSALIAGLFYLGWRNRDRTSGTLSRWAAIVITVVIPVMAIGVFEGAYNHVLKNILYFGGLPIDVFRALFPAPTYELPDNWFFELTGCAQFFVALLAAFALVPVIRRGTK
jgi:hypothetical protein